MNDTETLVKRAAALGRQHREQGITPYGDLDDGGSAPLMNELGQTSPTTEENWGQRIAMCNAYTEALGEPVSAENCPRCGSQDICQDYISLRPIKTYGWVCDHCGHTWDVEPVEDEG